MATLPKEQVTQRNRTADVSITYDGQDDSPGEKLWLSTTTLPYTVVATKNVLVNQQDRDVLEDRIVAAGEAQYTDQDLYAGGHAGVDSLEQPLTIVGDGTETLTVANGATVTMDISNFVVGGYTPLTYAIDAASETSNGTYSISGSYLRATWGSAGSDTVRVNVTDRDANTVQIVVTVTLSA